MKKKVFHVTALLHYNGTHVIAAPTANAAQAMFEQWLKDDPADVLFGSELAGYDVLAVEEVNPRTMKIIKRHTLSLKIEEIDCPDCRGDGDCTDCANQTDSDAERFHKEHGECPNGGVCETCRGELKIRVVR